MGFRYIGSKERLAPIILAEINRINPNARRVIDLMAGTGSFSLALRQSGFLVTAVDIMTYSYHHLRVALLMSEPPEFSGLKVLLSKQTKHTLFGTGSYAEVIDHLNALEPIHGYCFREFGEGGVPLNGCKPRKYFTAYNAAMIDAIRSQIKDWNSNGLLTKNEHSLLLHDLIMAANDVANIAGTYGHFLSRFVKRAEVPIRLTPTSFTRGLTKGHKIYCGYAEDLSGRLYGDICYIDPPYMKRQYAANYHLLETLAREDEPEAIGKSGLRPWRSQYSNFCSKVKIRNSLDIIISRIHSPDILVSYSEDGLLSIEELTNFLQAYGEVSTKTLKYKRFKSNDSKKGPSLTEYIVHIRKTKD